MDEAGLFAAVPIWGALVATLFLVLASVEAGFRWARYNRGRYERDEEGEKEAPVGAMVGATLGLLAFLLAFAFGMASDAFHERKVALLEEANAIRIAYLQTAFVGEPQRSEVRRLLRAYVDERLQWTGVERRAHPLSAKPLLGELGRLAAAEGQARPDVATVAMFIDSIDRIVALHAERVMLRERSRIPTAVWVVLVLIAVVALTAMGYHGGVAGTTRSPVMLAVAIAFSLVIGLIVDLNRPGEGWVNVGQEAMIDLKRDLAGER